jgi:hypothetical protein
MIIAGGADPVLMPISGVPRSFTFLNGASRSPVTHGRRVPFTQFRERGHARVVTQPTNAPLVSFSERGQ